MARAVLCKKACWSKGWQRIYSRSTSECISGAACRDGSKTHRHPFSRNPSQLQRGFGTRAAARRGSCLFESRFGRTLQITKLRQLPVTLPCGMWREWDLTNESLPAHFFCQQVNLRACVYSCAHLCAWVRGCLWERANACASVRDCDASE